MGSEGNWWQLFKSSGGRIVHCQTGKVMEVARDGDGQNVFVKHQPRNSKNQMFSIKYVDKTTVDRRYSKGETNKEFGFKVGMPFSIYTRMSCGRAIDIVGNSLVVKRKNGKKTQNWIFNDDKRTI
jgi:hypothetical protein